MVKNFFIILLLGCRVLCAGETLDSLLYALELAECIDKKLCERFPITYNHTLSTGYFTTPSARMAPEGEIGFGVAHVPPYLHLSARVQPFYFLELSGNYRIFRHIKDPELSPHGFGDLADRGANLKFSLVTPEDSYYGLPGIAFGVEDFMGSKKFTNYFVVATQVWQDFDLETSIGWGAGRYSHGPSRGFFGGFNWFPFNSCSNFWIKGLCFSAEFDPIDYKNPHREPHPEGRKTRTPINFGVKYNLGTFLEVSASFIRGQDFAFAGSLQHNWGASTGFLPKLGDSPPYTAPLDTEPIGCLRPAEVMVQGLNFSLMQQGFQLTRAWLQTSPLPCTRLYLSVINRCYRQEHVMRMRLQYLLACLTPSNVDEVVVIVESYGLPCQQYVYSREILLRFLQHTICQFEFDILTPREDVCMPDPDCLRLLFSCPSPLCKLKLSPRFESFFGSASGKFKYDIGAKANLEGFLPQKFYYEAQASYTIFSNIHDIGDFDLFNPSQLPNVATDYIRYRQENTFTIDRLYIQKMCHLGGAFFGRASAGYYQVNYAGVAGEALWYPACGSFAIGLEGPIVKKRSFQGLGFQSKLRHFEGFKPVFRSYSNLQQYFLSLYLDFPQFSVFTKLSVGQFLARDKGGRLEATRYFRNGLRLTGWITYTNARDKLNGKYYYDRGISIEIPFDLFNRCSTRRVWNYGLAAWLRDAGYATSTGKPLFEIINRERRF